MSSLILGRDADLSVTPTTTVAGSVSKAPSPAKNVQVFLGTLDLSAWWTAAGVSGAAVNAASMLDDEVAVDAVKAGWGGTLNGHLVADADPWTLSGETLLMIVDADGGWSFAAEVGVSSRPTTAPGDGHQAFTAGWTQIGDSVVAAPKTSGTATLSSGQVGWYWDASAKMLKALSTSGTSLQTGDVAVLGAAYAANNTVASGTAAALADGTVSALGWTDSAQATVIPGGRGVRRSALAPQRARTVTAAVEGSKYAAAILAYLNGRRTATKFTRRDKKGDPSWAVQAIAQTAWSAQRAANRTTWQATFTADGNPTRSTQ